MSCFYKIYRSFRNSLEKFIQIMKSLDYVYIQISKIRLFRLTCENKMSSPQIVYNINLTFTGRTFRKHFCSEWNTTQVKLSTSPPLAIQHNLGRVHFTKTYVQFGDIWKEIVFSDTNKWGVWLVYDLIALHSKSKDFFL